MKHKFSSMGRVAIALVLALSLSLVMAVPVAADVSSISVTNDPQTEGRAAEYTIDFTTNAALFAGLGNTITITFPADTIVPSGTAAYDTYVTVDSVDCADGAVSGSGQAVTITVPADINAGEVTVVIDLLAGVENPTTVATTWKLTVATSAEPVAVDSAEYSTIAVVVPTISTVAGITYQNGNDTIVITFSELVAPADGTWSANEFSSVIIGATALPLANADFAYAATILTITLSEADGEYLVKGTGNLAVTPATDAIENEFGDAVVAADAKTGDVTGDDIDPTVALTYSLDRPVKDADTLVITATFSEAMAASPTIAIVTTGDDLTATAMTGSGATWTYDYNVPAGNDPSTDVTIAGADLAGNTVTDTSNHFVIDNTLPAITTPATDIIGTTISGAGDTIVITFSEAVTAGDGTWSANELTIESVVDSVKTAVTLTNAVFVYDTVTLTITLDEATDGEYLVNGETLTVTPAADAIKDIALNAMAITAVVGTAVVSGDVAAPTITEIVGIDTSNIRVTFSEAVVADDGTWSADEFIRIESPDNAPLNINHATFDPATGMATVLTITLNEAVDGASLVAGVAIYVTPREADIVDLAGNTLTAGEVNSGADAGWFEVWVDDSWINQDDVDDFDPSLIWDANAFDTIQEGIDAVAIGGTVNVAAGTYTQDLVIAATKTGLELAGATDATIKGVDTLAWDVWPLPDPNIDILASGVKIHGFTIESPDGVDGFYSSTIVLNGTDIEIYDNEFVSTGTGAVGWVAIQTYRDNVLGYNSDISGLNIHDNDFSGNLPTMGYVAVFINHTLTGTGTVTVQNNIFTGHIYQGVVTERDNTVISGNDIITDMSDGYAIIVMDWDSRDQDNVTITGNTIKGSSGFAEGIRIGDDDPDQTLTNISITNNTIQGNAIGIKVRSSADGVVVNNNNISGNATYGVENIDTDVTLDAENNWWGTAVEAAIKVMVSSDVDYSPWLNAPYPYGEPTTTDSPTIAYPIHLAAGWNLVSLPLIPFDSSIETVLAELITAGTVNQVRTWVWEVDVLVEKAWLGVGIGDLTQMVDGQGYWIEMSAADTLVVAGNEFAVPPQTPPTYDVDTGWNMTGFTALAPDLAGFYLGSAVANTLEAMYRYNAAEGLYYVVIVVAPDKYFENPTFWEGEFDDRFMLFPGEGYWLAVSADGTIYP